MLLARARRRWPTRSRCSPTRSRCRCTASRATRRHRAARRWSTAPARSARRRSRSCARCTRRRGRRGRALPGPGGARASGSAPTLVLEDPFDRMALIEQLAAWSGGELVRSRKGCRWRHPARHRRRLRHRRQGRDLRGRRARAARARHAGAARRARGATVGVRRPLYVKEVSLGRLERLRHRGGRRRAPARHRPLPRPRRRRPRRPRRAAHAHLRPGGLAHGLPDADRPGRDRRDQGAPSTYAPAP